MASGEKNRTAHQPERLLHHFAAKQQLIAGARLAAPKRRLKSAATYFFANWLQPGITALRFEEGAP
jgi:hypothetical protein